jgi:hypothetical protein
MHAKMNIIKLMMPVQEENRGKRLTHYSKFIKILCIEGSGK